MPRRNTCMASPRSPEHPSRISGVDAAYHRTVARISTDSSAELTGQHRPINPTMTRICRESAARWTGESCPVDPTVASYSPDTRHPRSGQFRRTHRTTPPDQPDNAPRMSKESGATHPTVANHAPKHCPHITHEFPGPHRCHRANSNLPSAEYTRALPAQVGPYPRYAPPCSSVGADSLRDAFAPLWDRVHSAMPLIHCGSGFTPRCL